MAELTKRAGIALGLDFPDECYAIDQDRSGTVIVSELVSAIDNAITGCP